MTLNEVFLAIALGVHTLACLKYLAKGYSEDKSGAEHLQGPMGMPGPQGPKGDKGEPGRDA